MVCTLKSVTGSQVMGTYELEVRRLMMEACKI